MATTKNTGIVLKREERPFGTPRESRNLRTIKLIRFSCPENLHQGNERAECEAAGHDPFYTTREVEVRIPTLEERDGKTFKTGEEVLIERVRTPNWEQVVDAINVGSGRHVQNALDKGWVYPEELGYAPFCEYLSCSIQNPKFRTPVGVYHHRDEGALMMLERGGRLDSTEGTAIFVETPQSHHRRRLQLDEAGASLKES